MHTYILLNNSEKTANFLHRPAIISSYPTNPPRGVGWSGFVSVSMEGTTRNCVPNFVFSCSMGKSFLKTKKYLKILETARTTIYLPLLVRTDQPLSQLRCWTTFYSLFGNFSASFFTILFFATFCLSSYFVLIEQPGVFLSNF